MKKTILRSLQMMMVLPALAFAVSAVVLPASNVSAAPDLTITGGANAAKGDDQEADLFGADGMFRIITNVLLFLIGAISVIMLIIGGIRYTISGGDSGQVTSAKNTILYAIVGIVVALLAYAVVNFVLTSFKD